MTSLTCEADVEKGESNVPVPGLAADENNLVSMGALLREFGINQIESNIVTIRDVDIVGLACCSKTDAACWTQM